MVDIFLIASLVVPFVEVRSSRSIVSNLLIFGKVILQTYIEFLRGKLEDSQTINHHGKALEVQVVGLLVFQRLVVLMHKLTI